MGLLSIKQVSCGENHTLALVNMLQETSEEEGEETEPNRSNELFVWGNNS
jgi:hypothetical protein